MTPDSQIVSIIHKIRKTLHESENREILETFKHQIEKLEDYEEYNGSIFTILCAIPVDREEIDQLIAHFCQIR